MPKASFKPLTASDAQLAANGYPPRPPSSDRQALASWTYAVKRAHFEVPHPVCGSTRHSTIPSGIWSGHVVPESLYNVPIVQTASSWIQPSVPADSNYSNYKDAPDASFWTGTGLVYIIQDGCDTIATATVQYRCWTEDYPQNTIWEGPVVAPDDTVYAYDDYLGSNETSFYIENVTTGEAQAFTNHTPYVGLGSADYINERLSGLYLPDYGGTEMTGNSFYLQNGNYYGLGDSGGNNIYVMTSNCKSSGQVLSSPSFLSGDNFFLNFEASSPYCNS